MFSSTSISAGRSSPLVGELPDASHSAWRRLPLNDTNARALAKGFKCSLARLVDLIQPQAYSLPAAFRWRQSYFSAAYGDIAAGTVTLGLAAFWTSCEGV